MKEKAGPGYFCPCLDPLWTAEQIGRALAKHAEDSARLKTA